MIEQHLIEYLANAFWQFPLLAAGAWLLLRMTKPSPAAQHRIWMAVLGLALLLPLYGTGDAMQASAAQSNRLVGSQPAAAVQAPQSPLPAAVAQTPRSPLPDAFETVGQPGGVVLGMPGLVQQAAPGVLAGLRHAAWVRRVRLSATAANWIAGLYLIAMLAGLLRLARAWREARRLARDSREISLPDREREAVAASARRMGVNAPQVRESDEISGPVVVGAMTPVLLWPEGFGQRSQDELMAAMCHEMAHIRRRDYLMNLLCEAAAVPLKWHPVTHGVERRIRGTREMACDAMAAGAMESEEKYAKCLVELAQSMVYVGGVPEQAAALGLFSNNVLEERVMRLMQARTTMSARAKLVRAATGAAAMMAAIGLAATFHVCLATAQTAPGADAAKSAAAAPKDGVKGGVVAPESANTAGMQAEPVVSDQCARTVHVATDAPVVVHVAPIAPEVHVAPITPAVDMVPAVNVRSVVKDIDVAPVVNISEIAPDVHVMKIAPMVSVAPIVPMMQAAPANPSQAGPASPSQTAPASPSQAAPASPSQAAPASPSQAAPASPSQAAPDKKKSSADHEQCDDDGGYAMVNGVRRKLTPEERRKLEAQLAEAQKKIAAQMARINSPEFRKQIEDAQRQAMEAEKRVESGEFQKQMADAQKQIADAQARINSPEFKAQMDKARRDAMEAERKVENGDYKKQMADAQARMAEAMAKLNSPEFKAQIDKAQRDAMEAEKKVASGEIQRQMAEAQKQLQKELDQLKAEQDKK